MTQSLASCQSNGKPFNFSAKRCSLSLDKNVASHGHANGQRVILVDVSILKSISSIKLKENFPHFHFLCSTRKMLHHHWDSVMSVFRYLVFITFCLFITRKRKIINFGYFEWCQSHRPSDENLGIVVSMIARDSSFSSIQFSGNLIQNLRKWRMWAWWGCLIIMCEAWDNYPTVINWKSQDEAFLKYFQFRKIPTASWNDLMVSIHFQSAHVMTWPT